MSSFSAKVLNTVNAITEEQWQSLNCLDNAYFTPEFLLAYEKNNPEVKFNYILVKDQKGEAIAIANLQTITLSIDVILKNIKLARNLKKIIRSLFRGKPLYILFCGNVFLSGEHGIFLKQGYNKHELFNVITEEIRQLAKRTKGVQAIFIKDFYKESLYVTDELLNFCYAAMPVEPNMILQLDSKWKSFEDYKNSLKSKYRVKVNKADKTSATLEMKAFDGQDFARYKDELQQLYENTIANADFNAQVLDLNTYVQLRKLYKEDFIVHAYFYNDELVGFLSALVTNNHLDAHFIGLNYDLNRQCAIYPRILNHYVRLGIEKGVSQINFGRTASEIKSTIGAEPEQLMCYIRHKKAIPNAIVKPFFKMITLKDFKKHQPFKINNN